MKNSKIIEKLKKSPFGRFGLVAMGTVGMAGAALADPPSPVDYSSSISAFTSTLQDFFSSNGGLLIGALVLPLSFGLIWKLIKRAAKAV